MHFTKVPLSSSVSRNRLKMLTSASPVHPSPFRTVQRKTIDLLLGSVVNVRDRIEEFFLAAVPMFFLLFFESAVVEIEKVPGG